MIPNQQSVLTYATENRLSMVIAAERLLQNAKPDELRQFVAKQLAERAARAARREVTADLPDLKPEQLTLFEFHTQLPALVRTEVGGEELFLHWQNGTLAEHAESLAYTRRHHIQQAGIAERLERRIYQIDADSDVAIGYLTFTGINCIICGGPWIQNDSRGPFELAHDQPVAGRSGNATQHWAHRQCNRKEGVR
jgi:hypothetical protein